VRRKCSVSLFWKFSYDRITKLYNYKHYTYTLLQCTIYLFQIEDFSNKKCTSPVIHAEHNERAEDGRSHRLVWCPFANDDEVDPDTFALLVNSKVFFQTHSII